MSALLPTSTGTDLIFEKHLSRTPCGVADSVPYLLADGSVNEDRRRLIDILDRSEAGVTNQQIADALELNLRKVERRLQKIKRAGSSGLPAGKHASCCVVAVHEQPHHCQLTQVVLSVQLGSLRRRWMSRACSRSGKNRKSEAHRRVHSERKKGWAHKPPGEVNLEGPCACAGLRPLPP